MSLLSELHGRVHSAPILPGKGVVSEAGPGTAASQCPGAGWSGPSQLFSLCPYSPSIPSLHERLQ